MPEFKYAKGRIADSIRFISAEMKEFEEEYSPITVKEYEKDKKIQKLMERTVENILTALIEICGSFLIEEGIEVESYSDALRKTGRLLEFNEIDQEKLAELAIHRNRLAHRYLNFRWNAIKNFSKNRGLILKLVEKILQREEIKLE